MTSTNIGGLDLSYTGTAGVILSPQGDLCARVHISTKPADYPCPEARLYTIQQRVLCFFDEQDVGLIAIEGYAHGAKFGREAAGELQGTIRLALWLNRFAYTIVAVPTLKKFVTGKGTADKALILREVWRRWQYEAQDDNDADAYGLAQYARTLLQPQATWTKAFAQLAKKTALVYPTRITTTA